MMLYKFINDIRSSHYIIMNFINQDLTIKYKRSLLGFFWSLLNPIATMTITSIVFSAIMRFDLNEFAIFLFAGLIPWNFIAMSIDTSSVAIINNEGYIKKIYIPKVIFPVVSTTSNFITMLFSMGALFVIMLGLGAKISLSLIFLPISFMILYIFTLGNALIISILNVYFRDMKYIVGIILSVWYYYTPILYPIKFIPENIRYIFYLNPVYYIIELFRAPIYNNVFPDLKTITISVLIAFSCFLVGIFIFYKNEQNIVYRL